MNLNIRTKLLLIGITVALILILGIMLTVFGQNRKIVQVGEIQSLELAYADLDHIVDNLYTLADSHQEVTQKNIGSALNVARNLVTQSGGISFSNEHVNWAAVNQYTKENQAIQLPKMNVGDEWLGKISSAKDIAPLVDQIQDLLDVTCTVFQRMNENGDMLRVATNVIKTNGQRAIGTFIPAINPDGNKNPVISKILNGETFKGRAFVVNAWYITAYEPILDESKSIVGVLYVGIPQENVKSLRKAIMEMKIGRSGYVTVVDGSGKMIISKNGEIDGQVVINKKDINGKNYFKEIVETAKNLKPREVDEQHFRLKNQDNSIVDYDAKFVYFKPWDWIIIAQGDKTDFTKVSNAISAIGRKSNYIIAGVSFIILVFTGITWFFVANTIVKPINLAAAGLKDISKGEGDLTTRLPTTTKDEVGRLSESFNIFIQKLHLMIKEISEGIETLSSSSTKMSVIAEDMSRSSEQTSENSNAVATASEEMSANMNSVAAAMKQSTMNLNTVASASEEMNATINEVAQYAENAREITANAVTTVSKSTEIITQLSSSANVVEKVVETITDISEQVNLLSLNATIEAARAGDAGKGFAVVANEIKELAKQTSEASMDIKSTIEEIHKNSQNSLFSIEEISKVISEINDIVSTIATAVEEQSTVTNEIANNIAQASNGIEDVNSNVNQSSAVAAEITKDISGVNESSNKIAKESGQVKISAEDLQKLASRLDALVGRFKL